MTDGGERLVGGSGRVRVRMIAYGTFWRPVGT